MSFIGSDKKSSHRRLKILHGRLSLQDVIIETKNYNEPVYILNLFYKDVSWYTMWPDKRLDLGQKTLTIGRRTTVWLVYSSLTALNLTKKNIFFIFMSWNYWIQTIKT